MTARWSELERTTLVTLRAQGLAIAEIAAQLPGRNPRAIKNRLLLDRATKPLTAARVINAQPWEPLPGMVRRTCVQCRFEFAAPADALDRIARCPDCAAKRRRLAA